MLDAVLDLVLPRTCAGCGCPAPGLCGECARSSPSLVPGLGVPAAAGGSYDGALRQALLKYKERGRRDLAGLLGGYLASAAAQLRVPAGTLLIPVPSSRAARRERGGDHLLPVARRAAGRLGLRVSPALSLRRRVEDSAGLTASQRAVNIAGAMRADLPGAGRSALLVDDIVTTGATAREGVRVLEAAGWTVVGVALIAATPAVGSGAALQRYPARSSGTYG